MDPDIKMAVNAALTRMISPVEDSLSATFNAADAWFVIANVTKAADLDGKIIQYKKSESDGRPGGYVAGVGNAPESSGRSSTSVSLGGDPF